MSAEDLIRQALRARAFKGELALIAKNYGLGVSALDDWTRGTGRLPPDILQKMAQEFWGDSTRYDSERDLLYRIRPEPKVFAPAKPPTCEEMFASGQLVRPVLDRPAKPAPPMTKPKPRPGWTD
jgi:hypothetical protein